MSIDAKQLHPRSWSVACWAIFLIWLLFTVWVNFPFVMSGVTANAPSSELYEFLNKYGTVATPSGWPLPYMECIHAKTKPQYWLEYFPLYGILDLLLAIICHASIVVVMQTWGRKFSLATLFVAVGAISILLAIGGEIFATSNEYLASAFVIALYLTPVWTGITLVMTHRYKRRIAEKYEDGNDLTKI